MEAQQNIHLTFENQIMAQSLIGMAVKNIIYSGGVVTEVNIRIMILNELEKTSNQKQIELLRAALKIISSRKIK